MKGLIKRNLAFNSLSTLSLGLIAVISIPLILNYLDLSEWVLISTYQAIGAIASILISFGWNLKGSERISRTTRSLVHAEYTNSLLLQLLLFSITGILALAATVHLSSGPTSLYFLSFLSTSIVGIRPNWLYIGLGAPKELLRRETIPRVIMNTLGCFGLIATSNVHIFFLFQIIGLFIPIFLTLAWTRKISHTKHSRLHISKEFFLSNFRTALSPILMSFTSYLPLFILQHISISSAAVLALLLRLRIQFLTLISPVSDTLISKHLTIRERSINRLTYSQLSDRIILFAFTMAVFPLFVLLIGRFVLESGLNIPAWIIGIFSLYVSTSLLLFLMNSTTQNTGNGLKDVLTPIAGLFINSLGVALGYSFFELGGAILMMILSQLVMIASVWRATGTTK